MRATATAVATLVLLSLLAGGRAVAESPTDLTTARAQLAAVKVQIIAAESKRDALKAQISDLLARIDANRRALERQQPQIKAADASMADLSGRIDTQQAALDARAAEVYEQGPASQLALLLEATSFADFEARWQFVGAVARSDQDLIAQLGQRKAEQQALGTSLAASVAALEATRTQMAQEASALTTGLAQQLDVIGQLAKEQTTAQALVDQLTPAPTPSPTPTPTPTPTPPPYGGSVQDLIAQDFAPLGNGMVAKALCVAQLESGFNPNAFNPASGASGVFQFIPSTWAPLSQAAGWGGVSVFDAPANVGVAAWAVGQYGWSMWKADTKACGL
jgi:peptidoglycan hydrolase CwlO-like protein